jgi:hypothetical protein
MCGGPKNRLDGERVGARYCHACQEKVYRKYWEPRNFCGNVSAQHQPWACSECKEIRRQRQSEAAKRASQTRAKNYPNWQKPVSAEKFWQSNAHAMVSAAKKRGLLPELDGSIACVDCGAAAVEYDHRDYGRPLDVDPVCRVCNKKRGTAIWPDASHYLFKVFTPSPTKQEAA